jgi:hypothetical protein
MYAVSSSSLRCLVSLHPFSDSLMFPLIIKREKEPSISFQRKRLDHRLVQKWKCCDSKRRWGRWNKLQNKERYTLELHGMSLSFILVACTRSRSFDFLFPLFWCRSSTPHHTQKIWKGCFQKQKPGKPLIRRESCQKHSEIVPRTCVLIHWHDPGGSEAKRIGHALW